MEASRNSWVSASKPSETWCSFRLPGIRVLSKTDFPYFMLNKSGSGGGGIGTCHNIMHSEAVRRYVARKKKKLLKSICRHAMAKCSLPYRKASIKRMCSSLCKNKFSVPIRVRQSGGSGTGTGPGFKVWQLPVPQLKNFLSPDKMARHWPPAGW